MDRLLGIGEAAKTLGVSITTLRRWEASGRIAASRTDGKHRRYDLSTLRPDLCHSANTGIRKTIAYARVSSHDQKDDLERQKQVLELYCARQGWTFEVIADLGSGMNYQKKGLKRLLNAILEGSIGRLVIAHKDRLLRFGAELVFAICEAKQIEIVILNQGEDTTFENEHDHIDIDTEREIRAVVPEDEKRGGLGHPQNNSSVACTCRGCQDEDLAKDVLEIITVFSARLYGLSSRKNKKLLDNIKAAVESTC